MTSEEQREHEKRLCQMADGRHEGPLTPEDIAALKWSYAVCMAARAAARKLWTMIVRAEVEPRMEIEELVALFHDEDPSAARIRLAAERGKGGGR